MNFIKNIFSGPKYKYLFLALLLAGLNAVLFYAGLELFNYIVSLDIGTCLALLLKEFLWEQKIPQGIGMSETSDKTTYVKDNKPRVFNADEGGRRDKGKGRAEPESSGSKKSVRGKRVRSDSFGEGPSRSVKREKSLTPTIKREQSPLIKREQSNTSDSSEISSLSSGHSELSLVRRVFDPARSRITRYSDSVIEKLQNQTWKHTSYIWGFNRNEDSSMVRQLKPKVHRTYADFFRNLLITPFEEIRSSNEACKAEVNTQAKNISDSIKTSSRLIDGLRDWANTSSPDAVVIPDPNNIGARGFVPGNNNREYLSQILAHVQLDGGRTFLPNVDPTARRFFAAAVRHVRPELYGSDPTVRGNPWFINQDTIKKLKKLD